MNRLDVRKTSEVPVVKGQNPLNAMDLHGRGKSSVMDLNTSDTMRNKEFAPLGMDFKAIREQSQSLFEELCSLVCFLRRKSVAVPVDWTSTRVPEFTNVL
jgi:hypothetical protein